MPKEKMMRAAIQLPADDLRRLDEIADDMKASRAQVLRAAFRIYDWLIDLADEDKELLTRDQSGSIEKHHYPESLPRRK